METTTEQQVTGLSTDTVAFRDAHGEIGATPCAYTQVLIDPLCSQERPPSEDHQLAEESLVSQLPPDLSPPLLQSSDLKNSEHNIEPVSNTSAMSGITANEGILQTDKTLNASLSPFISRRGTPHVELNSTSDLQMIRFQYSVGTVQSPRLQSREVDDEAPSNTSPDNARSYSLPPSSSPPHIFSSSPFASSQSSLIETGDYKVADRAMRMESDDQDLISSPDGVYPDTLEEAYNDHDDTDTYQQRKMHEPHDLAIHGGSPKTNEGASNIQEVKPLPQKRSRPEGEIGVLGLRAKNLSQSPDDTRLAKCMKTHDGRGYLPPAPKRATLAFQQRQFRKLITPFRSPLMPNKDEGAPSGDLLKSKSHLSILPAPPPAPKIPLTPQKHHRAHVAPSVTPVKTRVRTLKAASQFKSPLSISASASSGRGSSIRLTPTVQSLERKLQLLKRAVKVKEDDEENTLIRLIKKWTEAGREVAYELWDLVKGSANKGDGVSWDGGRGKMGSRDSNWGWDSPGIKREGYPENEMDTAAENSLDEGYTNKIFSEDDEQTRNTMGTMLRQLGIATETLGWDEDAEVFFD